MVGLKGFVSFGNNFKLEGLGETIELDKVKDNADVYDGIAATSNNGTINKNVMIGSLKVTTDDGKVDVAANKSAVLYKADANGNLVSNNKGTADVSLGDGSTLTLAGKGKAGVTVNGNMRFGAVFNIGSGDADGKGNGNGLKDEFDYYGFGMYSAMGFGNFALVGDASLTVISHDVKGFDLHGKADTKAVTMGLTGQYTFATPAVDVTPHLGARFDVWTPSHTT